MLATDQGKRVRSEATSLISGNCCLADNDAHRRITQNCYLLECDRDCEDLRNIIGDWRHLRVRSPTHPRRSPARDVTPSGRGGFCAMAPLFSQVVWLDKFKAGHIDKYNGFSNPKDFIHVYYIIIESAGGDD
jgi:hypothetical protein